MVKIENQKGAITIDPEVFANLAGDAATSCFGVKAMAGLVRSNFSLAIALLVIYLINNQLLHLCELLPGLEPGTSSLPRKCSTAEL